MNGVVETKRDRVRRLLIHPLLRAGMRKQTRMKEPDYADMLVRLSDKLAHLSDQNIAGLKQWITRWAAGKDRNRWPDEVAIVSKALELQAPPPRDCPYVVSVMRSRAGHRAKDLGYHVELFMAALRFGPPFGKLNLDRLKAEAEGNRREVARVRDMIADGTAPDERRLWLDWYLHHEEQALAIMETETEGAGT